jgi:hypothetical protein
MSDIPRRSEAEENAIRALAYNRWDGEGRQYGRDLEHWLNAEASLQARGVISRRPILLPFSISFTARDVADPPVQTEFRAIRPEVAVGMRSLIRVATAEEQGMLASFGPLTPELLAHEARLVGAQIAVITAALDRICRLADWVVDQDSPDPKFFQPVPIEPGFYQLKPEYRAVLLRPDVHKAMVSDIDLAISNHLVAQGIAANVLEVSFGSETNILAQLWAMGWKRAIGVAAVSLGIFFSKGFITELGKDVEQVFVHPAIEQLVPRGTEGRIQLQPPQGQEDFWNAIQRDRSAEAAAQA